MKKIATEVGIKPASIYFFYKNKEELFVAAFHHLLEKHFNEMKRVVNENREKPVNLIFSAMLLGIVNHHKGDKEGTNAYISLVTSPIPEIHKYLTKHMLMYNNWLSETLVSALKKEYPSISDSEVDRTVKQFILIGNGVFWGINLYDGKDFSEQVELADKMIQSIFSRLEALP